MKKKISEEIFGEYRLQLEIKVGKFMLYLYFFLN
jgi:hypothetical protein